MATSTPTLTPAVPGRKTGKAPAIRKLALNHPELTHSEIARAVGCDPSNVTGVLKTFLANTSEPELREYQDAQADIFDALAKRLLGSLTEAKIANSKPMEAITGAAILIDKARLVRGQATGINVSVMHQLIEEIRADDARKPIVINAVTTTPNE